MLPDTTYLERHDCISLLDRPISEPDAASDAIRWPVVEPERPGHEGVRGFQSVLLDLGARLKLPGMVQTDGSPAYADYVDYMIRHQRRPGIGPLAGWRGADGSAEGRGAANPGQVARYIANGGFWTAHVPKEAAFFKPWNVAYQAWAVRMGFYDAPAPYLFELYSEPLARFQSAALGIGPQQPPEHLRDRLARAMAPLPVWYPPDPAHADPEAFPLHAISQRPAAMYHSWGSQNAWLRQIHGENPLYVPGALWEALGFEEGDWADLISPHARMTVPVARMDALNPWTVWTWNAIGKRPGAWALSPDAPEATRGFLLNHLIPDHHRGPRPRSPTPTRSPARPPGTTCAYASSASRRRPAASRRFRRRRRPSAAAGPNRSADAPQKTWAPQRLPTG